MILALVNASYDTEKGVIVASLHSYSKDTSFSHAVVVYLILVVLMGIIP